MKIIVYKAPYNILKLLLNYMQIFYRLMQGMIREAIYLQTYIVCFI